jgi:hypothetical protein
MFKEIELSPAMSSFYYASSFRVTENQKCCVLLVNQDYFYEIIGFMPLVMLGRLIIDSGAPTISSR